MTDLKAKLTRLATSSEKAMKSQRGKAFLAALADSEPGNAIGMNAAVAVRARLRGVPETPMPSQTSSAIKGVSNKHLLK